MAYLNTDKQVIRCYTCKRPTCFYHFYLTGDYSKVSFEPATTCLFCAELLEKKVSLRGFYKEHLKDIK